MYKLSTNAMYICACIYATSIPMTASAVSNYEFISLDAKFNTQVIPTSINNNGQILGSTFIAPFDAAYVIFDGDTKTVLNIDPGGAHYVNNFNDSNQIAGAFNDELSNIPNSAIWDGDKILKVPSFGGSDSQFTDINNSGFAVGYSTAQDFNSHATLWDGHNLTDLGALPGNSDSFAEAINDKGTIIGTSRGNLGVEEAVMWENGKIVKLEALPGTFNNSAIDINNHDQIIGETNFLDASHDNFRHATLWDHGNVTDLGTLGGENSVAYGINDSGIIVGQSDILSSSDFTKYRAFIWDGSEMMDLNSLIDPALVSAGWVLYSAIDINNDGWIIGFASNTITHEGMSYLLKYNVSPVPEPSSYAMLLLGLGLMGFVARSSKG